MKCAWCGESIVQRGAWREVTAWVSPKGGKGSTLSKNTGRLMHEACMHLAKSKVNEGQQALY